MVMIMTLSSFLQDIVLQLLEGIIETVFLNVVCKTNICKLLLLLLLLLL